MCACRRQCLLLTSCSLHSQQPSWSCKPVTMLPPELCHPACHSQLLSRSRLMRWCGEDVLLPRRCDVRVPSTMLATHTMQLALTATILEL